MTRLSDKVVVITGAGSGIGRALAINLAERGNDLALSDVNDEGLAQTVRACEQLGADVLSTHLDVADLDAWPSYAEAVFERFGRVNVIVNNAGVGLYADVEDQDWSDVQRVLSINLHGVIQGTQVFLPHVIASGDGHVVNVSSLFGFTAVPSQSAYNASKFGVRGYTEALAGEMKANGHRVGVSCVHPGGIKTNIARSSRVAGGDLADDGVSWVFERHLARTSPEKAASTIIDGVERNRPRIHVGLDARAVHLIERVAGARYLDIIRFGTGIAERFIDRATARHHEDGDENGEAPVGKASA